MRIALVIAAAILGGFGTRTMLILATRLGVMNYPNPIVRDHREAIPYLGGLGVLIGATLALILCGQSVALRYVIFGGFVAFLLLGLVDDVLNLRWWIKLSSQIAIAGGLTLVGFLGGFPELCWRITGWVPFDVLVSCLWLVAVVNAMNFLDVCDGVVASLAFINLLCSGWVVPSNSSVIYLAVAGGCVGFLWWNRPPARIYLGDCGSLGLGFLIAVAALQVSQVLPPTRIRLFTPILFAAVPLFELVFITTVRLQKGLPWWRGSPDHVALRLQKAGLKKYQVDLLLMCASVALWACGMIVGSASKYYALLLLALLLALAGVCWQMLLRWDPSPPDPDELHLPSQVRWLD